MRGNPQGSHPAILPPTQIRSEGRDLWDNGGVSWIASQRVIIQAECVPASIRVEGDRIAQVESGIRPDAQVIDGCILPGYVDTHCHGAAGFAFADPDREGVQAAISYHRRHGSTTLFASTVTETIDDLVEQITRLRGFIADGELDGIHLEGPFLAPSRKGAHSLDLLRAPDVESVTRLIDAGEGAVRMVTIAPELDGGLEACQLMSSRGVIPAFGHCEADNQVARASIDAGCTVATHLFNAMASIHHRSPGPIPALLLDERVTCELICDGVHVHPDVIAMAIDAARGGGGLPRVALVTDAMAATGQPDGDYQLGPLAVRVTDGVARIRTDDGTPGAIAGSTLTMDRAVEFLVQTVGVSLAEASYMASFVPARAHGLTDVGEVASGRRADLCITTPDGTLVQVMRAGNWEGNDAA